MKISRSPISPGEVLAGKYRIDGEVGAGSMGVVVKAWHMGLEQPVAVKFLYPEFAQNKGGTERFRREARAAAKIRSGHVVQVLDVGNYGNTSTPYIVMEHLEGRDLAAELKACGLVPWQDAVRYILEACEAIGEAHAQGIVHRDLKPANLFLHRRGNHLPTVKVLDFGISKTASLGNTQLSLTDTSTLMGSPAYMSPEQLESSRDVDGRADIWSLGVILHEMIVGDIPFKGTSVPQLVRSILAGKRTSLTERNRALAPLEEVVAKCLAQRPDRRFSDVGKLCQALRRCAKLPDMRRKKRKSGFLFRATAGLSRTAAPTPRARANEVSTNPLKEATLDPRIYRSCAPSNPHPVPNCSAPADWNSPGPRGEDAALSAQKPAAPSPSTLEPFAPVSSERQGAGGSAPTGGATQMARADSERLGPQPQDSSLALASPLEETTGPLPGPAGGGSAAAWGHTHNQRNSSWSRWGALGLALTTLGASIAYEYFAQVEAETQSAKTTALEPRPRQNAIRPTRSPALRPGSSRSRPSQNVSSLTASRHQADSAATPEPKVSFVVETGPSAEEDIAEASAASATGQNILKPNVPAGTGPASSAPLRSQPVPSPQPAAPQKGATERKAEALAAPAVDEVAVPPAAESPPSPKPARAPTQLPSAKPSQVSKATQKPGSQRPEAPSTNEPPGAAPAVSNPLSDFGGRK